MRKKIALRRISSVMRGYRKQKANNKLDALEKLNVELSFIPLYSKCICHSFSFGGMKTSEVDAYLRQFVMQRYGRYNLNPIVLRSIGSGNSIHHPLPYQWITKMNYDGYKINSFVSRLLWYFELFKLFILGVYKYFYLLMSVIRYWFKYVKREPIKKPYTYFAGINSQCISKSENYKQRFNLRYWFENLKSIEGKGIMTHSIVNMSSDVGLQYIESPLLPLRSFFLFSLFFLRGISLIFIAGFNLFLGRYGCAVLLVETMMAKYMQLMDADDLAAYYFFNNGNWLHRPLWSFEAEKKGAMIYLYFYSTNCERFKTENGYPKYDISCWHLMLWRNFFVWDDYQADFLKKHLGDKISVRVTGPIYYTDSALELDLKKGEKIAVFDVQPTRTSFYQSLSEPIEYYVASTSISFVSDILLVTRRFKEVQIVFKRKRKIGRRIDKQYIKYINTLEQQCDFFLSVDEEIHAKKVIEKSTAVISMPYTSTAVLAREMGKPTIYYDATGRICKDDIAAHGIKIVTSKSELAQWIQSVVNQ